MVLFDPAHPGELIRETLDGIFEETGKRLTVEQVANALGTTRKTLSAIINGKSAILPEMAIRLGTAFPQHHSKILVSSARRLQSCSSEKTR